MRIAYKFVFPLLRPSHKFLFDVVMLSLILFPIHGENLIHDVLGPEEAPVALDWSWQADHNPIHKVALAARPAPPPPMSMRLHRGRPVASGHRGLCTRQVVYKTRRHLGYRNRF